jgi:hypothetical protein
MDDKAAHQPRDEYHNPGGDQFLVHCLFPPSAKHTPVPTLGKLKLSG